LWVLGPIFTLIRGSFTHFMGSELFAPDLITVMTAYIFLAYGRMESGAFALTQGVFIDIFSGGMHGLFLLLYVIVYGTIWLGSLFFNLQSLKGQFIIIFFAMLLKTIVFVSILLMVSESVHFVSSFLWSLAMLTVVTALISPLMFLILGRIQSVICEDTGKGPTGQM
jgi:rod shape-determining protein MreD